MHRVRQYVARLDILTLPCVTIYHHVILRQLVFSTNGGKYDTETVPQRRGHAAAGDLSFNNKRPRHQKHCTLVVHHAGFKTARSDMRCIGL